jgi:hypothetical protein
MPGERGTKQEGFAQANAAESLFLHPVDGSRNALADRCWTA